jgi:hypothetical protein
MVELPAGAGDPGASLLQGDFLDEVVESTLRSIVSKIKVEYRKELSKALEAANLDGTMSKSSCVGDLASLTEPPEEARPTAQGDESCQSLRSAGEATDNLPFSDQPEEQPEEPAAAEPTLNVPAGEHGAGADDVECIRLGHAEGNRKLNASKSTDSVNKHDKGVLLTVEDQEDLKEIRDAENARLEAAQRFAQKGKLRNSTYHLMIPGSDELSWTKKVSFSLVASPKFDFGMGGVIIFNAVTIGLETSITRQGDEIPAYLHILEYSFLLAYCIELLMRIHAVGVNRAFISNWVKFDAVMVFAGILNFIITVSSLGGDSAASVVDNVNMLKMIRLFRLARTVRVLVQFRTLWMLVQGLMYAVLPMLWTAILMIVVIYVFAVIAMETILDDPSAGAGYAEAARNFDTIGDSMITLMQFMTLDSVAAVYRPLISSNAWFLLYFLVFLLMGPIALMNIVTAIMVESSLRTANEDQEAKKAWESMRKKNMMPKLKSIFQTLDTSNDGEVDLNELISAPPDIKEAMQHIVGLDELEEIFNMLDYDGSGSIDIEEFVDGIMRSQADKPSELIVLVKQSRAILEKLKDLGVRISVQQDDAVLPVGAMEGIKNVARRSSSSGEQR